MEIVFSKNEKEWDEFLLKNNGGFLQSSAWAKIQEANGKKVFLFAVKEGSNVLVQVLVVKEPLKLGFSFFYAPLGPCFASQNLAISKSRNLETLNFLIEAIKKQAKSEKILFLRLEPISEVAPSEFKISEVAPSEFKISEVAPSEFKNIQPKETWLFDLSSSIQAIENGLSQKVRYNIKLAQRKGVVVRIQNEYSAHFFRLLKTTSQRQEFRHFPESHYQNIFKHQNENFKSRMFLAQYQGKIIASHIVVIFNKNAYFLHAANDINYKETKVVNLLQWEKIKYAQEQACEKCDFWGYDEKRWPGFSAFKKSFGGYKYIYPERYTIPLNKPLFSLYRFLRALKDFV